MQGRTVLVTGSSRGIGLALARSCIALCARVVVHGRDRARLDAAVAELGGDTVGIAADLATPAGAEQLIRGALDACGRIDILVNNAGATAPAGPLWELAADELAAVIAGNLVGPMLCSRALLAHAVPRGDAVRIVCVSSGLAQVPRPHAASYVASKAGLEGMVRALARDVPANVVVTAVALAGHQTELTRAVVDDDEYARLLPPEAAVAGLLHAMTAPDAAVHGRVLGERPRPPLDVDAIDLIAHPLGPSPLARAALADAARDQPLDHYPEPPDELRKVLAAKHACALDAVIVGGGISELLDRTLAVATRPGELVVANTPSWPLWPHLCRERRVHWRAVPSRIVGDRVDPDLDAIVAACDRSVRAVYLASPSNPGGAALDRAAFDTFLAALPAHVAVVVDEAYAEYATRKGALDATQVARTSDRPIVALRTFSKFYGLAGLRAGYAVASRALAVELARAAPPFTLARGTEQAAIAALSDGAHARRTLERVASARARLEREFAARGIAFLASDAPFVLAAVPGERGPRYFDRNYALVSIIEEEPWATEATR